MAWLARLAASEGRRRLKPSWPRGACWPKEDHLRGEPAAEGIMLLGVLLPLSPSLHHAYMQHHKLISQTGCCRYEQAVGHIAAIVGLCVS